MTKLTKVEIKSALARLSDLAAADGVRLEMTIYGGAAMLLAYDARDVTKDVDAIIYPPEIGRRLVAKVAIERGWPENWLNDDVKMFVATKESKNELVLDNVGIAGLHITRPTAKYLLAMKVVACRKPLPGYAGDHQDIETLLRVTRLDQPEMVQQVVDSFFPDTVLSPVTIRVIEEILERIRRVPSAPAITPPVDSPSCGPKCRKH